MLLDAVKDRFEFPELRRKALEQYKYWQPEMVIVEAKASGLPLTYELRKMDIPVINFTPSKGNDKHVRVNSCAPVFESGYGVGRHNRSSQRKSSKNVQHFRMATTTT